MQKSCLYSLLPVVCMLLVSPFCAVAQQDTGKALALAETFLLQQKKNTSSVLSNPSFDFIKSKTTFRELVKKTATALAVQMVSTTEPGTPITIKGKLIDVKGDPAANKLLYLYQTDSRGWYGGDRPHFLVMEGDRKFARLFAYLRSTADGGFELQTIQPQGYPNSSLPAHIHIEVYDADNNAVLISELLFEDDIRLTQQARARAAGERFIVSKPVIIKNVKTYQYTLQVNQ